MQICMHPFCGPMPQNAVYGTWKILHTASGEDIAPLTIYADDEAGILWRFIETRDGIARHPAGAPEVEQINLGPGSFRLNRR